MEGLIDEWMDAGAVSFCTGLEYEPMRHADLRELVRLSKVTAKYEGIYVAHQRGYANNINRGSQETFNIGEQADIPVHISHLSMDERVEDLLVDADRRKIDVSFDMYPYQAGCSHLLMKLPHHLQVGPPAIVKERLKDNTVRRQMADHLANAFPLDRVTFAAVGTEEPTGWEGKTLRQVIDEFGMSLTDTV